MGAKKNKARGIEIPEPDLTPKKIRFSFEYYDLNKRYCLSRWNEKQIFDTLERLKQINEKTFNEMRAGGKVFHFHPVYWEKTDEPQGFPDKRIGTLEPFQFSLLGVNGQKARVFGGFSKDTFYVVWFDLEHKVWPTFKSHT